MKTFKIKIEYVGLAGKYTTENEIKAKNAKSAENKAYLTIGNRTGTIISVVEVI